MDMEQWARVRRQVLVDGESKRSVMSEEGLHWTSGLRRAPLDQPLDYPRPRSVRFQFPAPKESFLSIHTKIGMPEVPTGSAGYRRVFNSGQLTVPMGNRIYRNLPNFASILGIVPYGILLLPDGYGFLLPLIIYNNFMDDLDSVLAARPI